MSSSVTQPSNVAALAAPQLFGGLFNWCLYGALVVQVYIYYMTSSSDRKSIRLFLYGLFAFETAQSSLVAHDLYEAYAASWGKQPSDAFEAVRFEWFTAPLSGGIVSACVQLFYTWRIYVLGRSKLLAAVLSLLAVTQGVAGVVVGFQAKLARNFTQVQADTYDAVFLFHTAGATCDILITIAMMTLLSKSRTGFKRTDKILTDLIRLTLETGFLTATVAVLDLVLFLSFRNQNYYEITVYILSKLYSNNLFVLLNNRVKMMTSRDMDSKIGPGSLELRSIPVPVTQSGVARRSAFGEPLRSRVKALLPQKPPSSRLNSVRQGDGHTICIHVEEDIFRDEAKLGLESFDIRPQSTTDLGTSDSKSTCS